MSCTFIFKHLSRVYKFVLSWPDRNGHLTPYTHCVTYCVLPWYPNGRYFSRGGRRVLLPAVLQNVLRLLLVALSHRLLAFVSHHLVHWKIKNSFILTVSVKNFYYYYLSSLLICFLHWSFLINFLQFFLQKIIRLVLCVD